MEFSKDKTIDVACIGNALMDILVEVPDSVLHENNLNKGGMVLVDETESKNQLEKLAQCDVRTLPGGASANTARGVCALGGRATFFGSIGTSVYGKMYQDALESAGVDTCLNQSELLTGNAITYITSDHERTFSVHLGASADLPNETVKPEAIRSAKILYLEGFQLEGATKSVLEKAISIAKESGTLVALDLNDAALIERNLDLFKEVVADHVDILFVNEVEAAAFTGATDSVKVIEALKNTAAIVVYKCGEDGAQILHEGAVTTIAAAPAQVVDTTGAGDLFAAGFLYGLTHGQDLAVAGALGAKAAAAIISQIGVDTVLVKNIK